MHVVFLLDGRISASKQPTVIFGSRLMSPIQDGINNVALSNKYLLTMEIASISEIIK